MPSHRSSRQSIGITRGAQTDVHNLNSKGVRAPLADHTQLAGPLPPSHAGLHATTETVISEFLVLISHYTLQSLT